MLQEKKGMVSAHPFSYNHDQTIAFLLQLDRI